VNEPPGWTAFAVVIVLLATLLVAAAVRGW
jgi:hypothetical protein